MRYDRGVRRSSDGVFAGVLGTAMLFLYRPLLGQPLLLDDVGLFHFLRLGLAGGAARSFGVALWRCALPVYFRPLAAPVYWILFRILGTAPAGYRVIMLAAAWGSALTLGRIARRLGAGPVAARSAAALYAFSWIQWSGLTLVAGLAQSLSDLLFWTALLIFLRDSRPRLAPAFAIASAALLFKEHAIVWPLFAAAAAGPERLRAVGQRRFALAGGGWAAAYLLLRLASGTADFAGAPYAPRLDPAAALRGTAVVLQALSASWSALPARAGNPLEAAFALALGAAAAAAMLVPRAEPRPSTARLCTFALAGLAAGLLPYLAFPEALDADSVSRFTLAWGAAAVGVAAALESGMTRARAAAPRLSACAWIVAGSLLFFKTAALFRHPDGSRRVFSRWPLMAEARWLEGVLAPAAASAAAGDVFVFNGFRTVDRVPWRFQLLAAREVDVAADGASPRDGWTVALRSEDRRECVDVRPPAAAAWIGCRELP
jgi:hypothetical protein